MGSLNEALTSFTRSQLNSIAGWLLGILSGKIEFLSAQKLKTAREKSSK